MWLQSIIAVVLTITIDCCTIVVVAAGVAAGGVGVGVGGTRIVHRDLRTANILLVTLDTQAKVMAKVADFGLSYSVQDHHNLGGIHKKPFSSDIVPFASIITQLITKVKETLPEPSELPAAVFKQPQYSKHSTARNSRSLSHALSQQQTNSLDCLSSGNWQISVDDDDSIGTISVESSNSSERDNAKATLDLRKATAGFDADQLDDSLLTIDGASQLSIGSFGNNEGGSNDELDQQDDDDSSNYTALQEEQHHIRQTAHQERLVAHQQQIEFFSSAMEEVIALRITNRMMTRQTFTQLEHDIQHIVKQLLAGCYSKLEQQRAIQAARQKHAPLLLATQQRDWSKVQQYIQEQKKQQAAVSALWFPELGAMLVDAMQYAQLPFVEELIKSNVLDLNEDLDNGMSLGAVAIECKACPPNILALLLCHGLSANHIDRTGKSMSATTLASSTRRLVRLTCCFRMLVCRSDTLRDREQFSSVLEQTPARQGQCRACRLYSRCAFAVAHGNTSVEARMRRSIDHVQSRCESGRFRTLVATGSRCCTVSNKRCCKSDCQGADHEPSTPSG
jgi:hypothetical protein